MTPARKPRRQREGKLSDAIRARLAYEPGLVLDRNSQAVMRKGARVYRGGLGNGSADLVGVLTVRVSGAGYVTGRVRDVCAEPVVYHIGRYIALEVKMPGEQPTPQQEAWMQRMRSAGAFCAVVRSVEEAVAAIERARQGATS